MQSFNYQVNHIVLFFQVVSDSEREDSIRQVALENIVTLAETMPGLTRKQSDLIPHISKMLIIKAGLYYRPADFTFSKPVENIGKPIVPGIYHCKV